MTERGKFDHRKGPVVGTAWCRRRRMMFSETVRCRSRCGADHGAVQITTPFLRTSNPFSITVAVITLHRDGEPTKQKTGTGKGENRNSAGRVPVNGQRQNRTGTVRKGFLVNRKGSKKDRTIRNKTYQ
jgi:hypothetical protein